MYVGFFCLL